MNLMSFKDAIQATSNASKRHLLLGNGFSVALKPDIFRYDALIARANFVPNGSIENVFKRIGTNDFEAAVNAIESAATILPAYLQTDATIILQMRNDALAIKYKLIELVIGTHPDRPYDISDTQRDHCIEFLKNFKGKIFTLNYDIILYWVMMNAREKNLLHFNDGFQNDAESENSPYVVWNDQANYDQNVFYLHGALHLFDSKYQLRKYTWKRTDIALIDQARAAISEGTFPLFVSEGTAEKKKAKIDHSGYLHKAYRTLGANHGTIFCHGFSFSENDKHIINVLAKCYNNIYISIFGDPATPTNQATMMEAERMKLLNKSLRVNYYDSNSAKVWG